MKHLIGCISFLLIITLFFSSCSKKKDPNPSPGTQVAADGTMIATVGDKEWKSTQPVGLIINGTITIAGFDSANEGIELASLNSKSTGTFDVTGAAVNLPEALVSITPDGENAYSSTYFGEGIKVGTLVISEIDSVGKTMTGTFSSKVKRFVPTETEIEIKSGSFTKIPYTKEITPPVNDPNTFSAKVDGNAFSAALIGGVSAFGKITLNFTNSIGTSSIALSLPSTATTGSHDFGSIGSDFFGTYISNPTTYESVSGNVNITLHNTSTKRIEGTFSFSAEPFPMGGTAVAITEGSFAVTYF